MFNYLYKIKLFNFLIDFRFLLKT